MRLTKVTRNYQITLPKEVRDKLNISIGDILEVRVEGEKIVIRKVARKRKRIKLGKKLTVEEIERAIKGGFDDAVSH